MLKIVLDTNVLLKGFLSYTNDQRKIINLAIARKIQILGCDLSYEEFKEKLEEDRIKKIINDFLFPKDKLLMNYKSVIRPVTLSESIVKIKAVNDDADDDVFVWTALSGGASIIISEDNHLLKLKKFMNVRIINAADFMKIYSKISSMQPSSESKESKSIQ